MGGAIHYLSEIATPETSCFPAFELWPAWLEWGTEDDEGGRGPAVLGKLSGVFALKAGHRCYWWYSSQPLEWSRLKIKISDCLFDGIETLYKKIKGNFFFLDKRAGENVEIQAAGRLKREDWRWRIFSFFEDEHLHPLTPSEPAALFELLRVPHRLPLVCLGKNMEPPPSITPTSFPLFLPCYNLAWTQKNTPWAFSP